MAARKQHRIATAEQHRVAYKKSSIQAKPSSNISHYLGPYQVVPPVAEDDKKPISNYSKVLSNCICTPIWKVCSTVNTCTQSGCSCRARGARGRKLGVGSFTKHYLQLLQLWVEAGEGHVAHVGTRRGIALSHQHKPRLRSSSHPFALILFLRLWSHGL